MLSYAKSYRSGSRLRPTVMSRLPAGLAACLLLSACNTLQQQPPSAGHIRAEDQTAPNPDIPTPVAATPLLPVLVQPPKQSRIRYRYATSRFRICCLPWLATPNSMSTYIRASMVSSPSMPLTRRCSRYLRGSPSRSTCAGNSKAPIFWSCPILLSCATTRLTTSICRVS
jgi:hypothetical protein